MEFTPFNYRRLFCSAICLKKRDDHLFYLKNKDTIKKRTRAHAINNKEHVAKYQKAYRIANKHIQNINKRAWEKRNRPKKAAQLAKYRADKDKRTPPWLTQNDFGWIKLFYKHAHLLSKSTGTLHSVDHIVPLRGTNVSGLHVPWNLQILTLQENSSKGNRF